jgi:hypothetical protein
MDENGYIFGTGKSVNCAAWYGKDPYLIAVIVARFIIESELDSDAKVTDLVMPRRLHATDV